VILTKLNGKSYHPAFVGGLKIGTWFVKEGFLGFNYPDWMKYFGFYLDLSYHRLNIRGPVNVEEYDVVGGITTLDSEDTRSGTIKADGRVVTLAFMFAARYGFFPTPEVPFGRLQPYVGVGPAILITSLNPTLDIPEG
jgi:hypothetical protein